MRFLLDGPPTGRGTRPLVLGFLGFCLLFLAGFAAQRAAQGGLTAAGVAEHYLGPAEFPEPIAPLALWEEAHVNAFFYGFLLLLLGSVAVAGRVAPRPRAALLAFAFAATLADLAAPFAIVWAGLPAAARVATLFASQLSLLALVAAAALGYGRRAVR